MQCTFGNKRFAERVNEQTVGVLFRPTLISPKKDPFLGRGKGVVLEGFIQNSLFLNSKNLPFWTNFHFMLSEQRPLFLACSQLNVLGWAREASHAGGPVRYENIHMRDHRPEKHGFFFSMTFCIVTLCYTHAICFYVSYVSCISSLLQVYCRYFLVISP